MNALLVKMGLAAGVAALLTLLVVPAVKRLAHRYGAIREVRNRDVHDRPIPLWGGVAMFFGWLVTVLLMRPLAGQEFAVAVGKGEHPILGIILGAAVVAAVGMLDDKKDLSPKWQTLALLLGGFVAAVLGARIDGVTNPLSLFDGTYDARDWTPLGHWAIPVTMVWVFVAAKTFDFLDGLDGLAAGVCAIAASTMGLIAASRGEAGVALMAAALVGACFGFLRYNYNPASIFMGTVGSYFLGFVLAGLAVVGTVKVPATLAVFVPLLVMGVPVLDAVYVVIRRILRGASPTQADRTHIHHRLRDRGLTVRQAVWVIYGLTLGGCLAALLLVWNGMP
jgi:UDP-N-acetylmuramyl pentapeptide phosphotransferase/UDP-N-acetylglucosamine-1-phosphate transferase